MSHTCPQCGEDAQRKNTHVESGAARASIPDDATDYCIDVTYHTEHEVELTIYLH